MQRRELFLFSLLLAFVFCVYGWVSVVASKPWHFGEPQRDHYNLLVAGFLKGQLSLDAEVPPEFLKAANPYDPAQRPAVAAIHDASLYKGRYYIYFGPAPALAILLPYRALTGQAMPLGAALTVICGAGFACSLLLLLWMRRDWFPFAGTLPTAAAGLSLGFLSFAPILIRRHAMYEFAIAGGYAFGMAALLFLYRALRDAAWRRTSLAFSSLCLGLAFCSRPVFVLAPAVLLLALWHFWREAGRPSPFRSGFRGLLAAAALPLGGVCALMALYNYLRFGSVTEFGVTYILSGVYEAKVPHFGLNYVPYNLSAFLFHPPELDRYFPFLHAGPIDVPVPPFHFGTDALCGVLPLAPVVFAGFGLLLPLRTPASAGPAPVRSFSGVFLLSLLWTGASVLGLLLCFCAAMTRYTADFMPAFALLAAAGFLAAEHALRCRFGGRFAAAFAGLFGGAFVLCAAVALLAGLQSLDGLAASNPSGYERASRFFNRCVAALEACFGAEPGPLSLIVRFPGTPGRGEEELFRTSSGVDADRVLVSYSEKGVARFGLALGRNPVRWCEPLPCEPGSRHELLLQTGSLLPPATHPVFDGIDEERREALLCATLVAFDGVPVLFGWKRSLGSRTDLWSAGGEGGSRFSGSIGPHARKAVAESLVVGEASRTVLRLPAAMPNGAASFDGISLPPSAQSLSVRFESGRLTWRLGLKDGSRLEAFSARPGAPAFVCDLVRLSSSGSSGAGSWLLSLDGGVVGFGKAAAEEAEAEPSALPGAVVSSSLLSSLSFPENAKPLRLDVRFPEAPTPGTREPLLVAGDTGRGDFLFVEYLAGNRFRLGWDHWGASARWSEPADFVPGESGALELGASGWSGSLRSGEVPLTLAVSWRGRELWREAVRAYPVTPDRFYLGHNPIGGSSCVAFFSGELR